MIKVAKLGDIWVGPRPRAILGSWLATRVAQRLVGIPIMRIIMRIHMEYMDSMIILCIMMFLFLWFVYRGRSLSRYATLLFFFYTRHTPKKNASTRMQTYGFRQSKCSVAELWAVHDTEEASCRRAWARWTMASCDAKVWTDELRFLLVEDGGSLFNSIFVV